MNESDSRACRRCQSIPRLRRNDAEHFVSSPGTRAERSSYMMLLSERIEYKHRVVTAGVNVKLGGALGLQKHVDEPAKGLERNQRVEMETPTE
jgi:hypothetical protein